MERVANLRDRIRTQLSTQRGVILAGEIVGNTPDTELSRFLQSITGTVEQVQFFIAPTKPITKAYSNRLKEFMEDIVTFPANNQFVSFRSYKSSILNIGCLEFSEQIGIRQVKSVPQTIAWDTPEIILEDEAVETSQNLFRRILIRPFPNAFIAWILASYESERIKSGTTIPLFEDMTYRDREVWSIDLSLANRLYAGLNPALIALSELNGK